MQAYPLTSLATVLLAVLMIFTVLQVARARRKSGIAPPAMTGDPLLERALRAQMNTLEGVAIFLPLLWLLAIWWTDQIAAICGLLWCVLRLWYALAYVKAARQRILPFALSFTLINLSVIGVLAGIIRHWF
ncbi:MAPEG family protein [Massilia sp. W12]|uniref:MAPEG family protein n=1 Tax=Massilia sp. W12 TaxID=3126507 RepID=UPI0030CCD8E5